MLKLSVALLLVAFAIGASARPQYIAARALRHARTAHNALKRNTIFDDDKPVIERQDNNVVEDEDNDDDDFQSASTQGLKQFEVAHVNTLVQGLENFLANSLDEDHRPKIHEIFNKYPKPDYSDENSVQTYLENVGKDVKAYIKSKGLSDPFNFSDEDEDDSDDNEV